jgi:hypothetical protein
VPQLLRDVQHLLSQLAAALDADFEPELSAKFVSICTFVLTNASLFVLLYQLSTRMREQARLVSMALAHMSAVASSGHRVPFMTHAFVVSSSCE